MGFLTEGEDSYNFEDSRTVQKYIKEQGIIQFLKLYQKFWKLKQPKCIQVTWGDEMELQLLAVDDTNKQYRLQCNTQYIFSYFSEKEKNEYFQTHKEYGSWMVETVPQQPYTSFCNFQTLITNISLRRKMINQILKPNDRLFSISCFPMLGIGDYYIPRNNDQKEDVQKLETNFVSRSQFTHDLIISSHKRFITLTKNIRERRNEKVCILTPLFKDINTNMTQTTIDEPFPGFIYMDSMAYGMGSGCVQVTFSTKNVSHARFMYDQLAIICPFFMALSAASPIFKGKLQDKDTRWHIISQSVDDRTENERNPQNKQYIPKSRYDSISQFIAPPCNPCQDCFCKICLKKPCFFRQEYNDIKFPLNQELMNFARNQASQMNIKIDENLINHLGFLFSRDALVIFKDKVENINEYSTEHFENLQSTNWNSVRFKPPPGLNSDLPWRVEFRPMELQLTEFDNVMLIELVVKTCALFFCQEFNLNFYLPISYVDKNFERAQNRNAILNEKFFVRQNIFDAGPPIIVEIYLKEFFLGGKQFIGLKELSSKFLKHLQQKKLCKNNGDETEAINLCVGMCSKLLEQQYQYIEDKVTGKKPTVAVWIREFVKNHPKYKKDSIITHEITYDLLNEIYKLSEKSMEKSEEIIKNHLSTSNNNNYYI